MRQSCSRWGETLDGEEQQSLRFDSLKEGKAVHAEIGGRSVCFLKRGDTVYAFRDICPHIGGRLSEGVVSEKNHVVCPVHSASFDIVTGKSLSFSRKGLTLYDVSIENGYVVLGKEREALWREKLPDPRDAKWAD